CARGLEYDYSGSSYYELW
nr:immunoglobulin heavy chain junction region [Macaca mulatta]